MATRRPSPGISAFPTGRSPRICARLSAAHLLRPDLFRQGRARADHPACRRRKASRCCKASGSGANRADNRREIEAALKLARQPSRHGQGADRRQRDAAQGRARSRRRSRPISRRSSGARAFRSPMPMSGSSGSRRPSSPRPPTSSPSISCPIGRTIRSAPRTPSPMCGRSATGAGGLPRQGDLDRRGGLAERRADARRRAPLPGQPGALPERRVAAAKQGGWKVNLIEAFDQPWKRLMEGTVGGYWGLYDDQRASRNSTSARGVSNHPDWRLKAGLGIGAALLVFLSPLARRPRRPDAARVLAARRWPRRSSRSAPASSSASPRPTCRWKAKRPSDRLRAARHARSRSGRCRMAAAFAVARGDRLAGFAEALDPAHWRAPRYRRGRAGGAACRDGGRRHPCRARARVRPSLQGLPIRRARRPRHRARRPRLRRSRARRSRAGAAEIAAAVVLAGSALFVIVNEGIANWQALLFAGAALLLALTLFGRRPRQAEHEQRDRQRRGARVVKHEPEQREDRAPCRRPRCSAAKAGRRPRSSPPSRSSPARTSGSPRAAAGR